MLHTLIKVVDDPVSCSLKVTLSDIVVTEGYAVLVEFLVIQQISECFLYPKNGV